MQEAPCTPIRVNSKKFTHRQMTVEVLKEKKTNRESSKQQKLLHTTILRIDLISVIMEVKRKWNNTFKVLNTNDVKTCQRLLYEDYQQKEENGKATHRGAEWGTHRGKKNQRDFYVSK